MRWIFLPLSAIGITAVPAMAQEQESLCNPCIDPPIRTERPEFRSPSEVDVITPAEMRMIGVIDVADMVNQLPNDLGSLLEDDQVSPSTAEDHETDSQAEAPGDSDSTESEE